MTVEYIVKRIYKKLRIIGDFDLLAIRKLTSGYKYFTSVILIVDIVLILSKYFIMDESISTEIAMKYIYLMNIALIFFAYRIWKNNQNHKYGFPELTKYISDLKQYSNDDLRKLVKQVNRRQQIMERLVKGMIEFQIMIPLFVIIGTAVKIYQSVSENNGGLNFGFIFFMTSLLVSAIGFLLGARTNPRSFKRMQNSIAYKIRNLIIDALVFSPINPGSNEIRKSNK